MGRNKNLAVILALALLLVVPAAAGADASSLYQGPGPRPGPDLLYQPLADAPQLQNTGDWSAPPILVSGASAYRDGEFLYQDFLYDDSGAIGSPVQNDPRFSGNAFSRPTGTYTYPTDTRCTRTTPPTSSSCASSRSPTRPRSGSRSTRSRTPTTSSATTIAIGDSAGLPAAWPHGANVIARRRSSS